MDIQKVIFTQRDYKIIQSATRYSTLSKHDFCIQILVDIYSSVVFCSVSKHGTEELSNNHIKLQ
jgi:hypothetical protein